MLADARYWSNDHIDSLRERGMIPIVAADTTRNRPRKNRRGGPYDFMRRVMASEAGSELNSKRQRMVEPVFAQIKTNRRIEAPPAPVDGRNGMIGGPKGPAAFRSARFHGQRARSAGLCATASRGSDSGDD